MKTSKHVTTPRHFYVDNTPYFITAATWQHRKLLTDECKTRLLDILHEVMSEYGWALKDWVILDDHYHVLCHSKYGVDLTRVMNKAHNLSAQFIKQSQDIDGKIWCNYWDYCPRDDKEYNTRLYYLLNNPYKHGYVKSLHDWEWSSFHKHFKDLGHKALHDEFLAFPEYQTLMLDED